MFYVSWHGFQPRKKKQLVAPRIQAADEISIVIPVKGNSRGIADFFENFAKTQLSEQLPQEILIVCDRGATLKLPRICSRLPIEVTVLFSNGIGPASARNAGWKNARGEWILFTDSDCTPTSNWLNGYIESNNGSIGYAGTILSHGVDFISKYYESQNILMPPANNSTKVPSPDYIITANALVWKRALEEIGGFNETIKIAAGEDIDVGFRLREIGDLSFAPKAAVIHNFNDGLAGFMKRFRRYGKGNRLLAEMYALNMKPRGIRPRKKSLRNSILAYVQYLSLLWGYYFD